MTNRSEANLTEILDRFCAASNQRQRDWAVAHGHPADAVKAWDDLTPVEKHKIKDELLPLMMAVLDVADEVDGHEGWERIFEVHASLDPEQRGSIYLLAYPDGTTVTLGDAEDNYAELAGIIDDEYEKETK